MIGIKTLLAVAGVAIGGGLLLGKNKFDEYRNVLNQMKFKIKSVKGIKLISGNVVFDVDMELTNPTDVAITVPGKKLVVKNLHFFTPSGKKLGVASPNISDIDMPANGSRIITNVPATISLDAVGSSFSEVLSAVLDPAKLKVTADLEAFGKSFSVKS